MSVSRNAPCPCGSGRKYKKCCLPQAEKAAAEQRRRAEAADAARLKDVAELDELSNKTNDLIHAARWDEAARCCRELQERFPDETDGDERFSQYYTARNDFALAKAHTQAALDKAAAQPAKFDPELLADLREHIAYLDECIQAGRRLD
jgi:hypothetical protein